MCNLLSMRILLILSAFTILLIVNVLGGHVWANDEGLAQDIDQSDLNATETLPLETNFFAEKTEEQKAAEELEYIENSADEGSVLLEIPEPLHFDLMRPLGAKRGEIEVNTLGLFAVDQKPAFEWAPEVEYVFKDGHALELELPFLNSSLTSLKLGYQLTLPQKKNAQFAHGIQSIARYNFDANSASNEVTYIYGRRINQRLSLMTLTGIRSTYSHRSLNIDGLINPTIFCHINKRLTLGIEKNLRIRDFRNYDFNILPQFFVEFGRYTSLQVGAGITRKTSGSIKPLLGMRLIFAFH